MPAHSNRVKLLDMIKFLFPPLNNLFTAYIAAPLTHIINLTISQDNQYGFRRNHSTSLALVNLYDIISLALDRKEFAAGVFADLSKAFDTVSHNIDFFSDKLPHYGIQGLELDWVKSNFYQRSQFVEYNGHRSLSEVIRCGVPRGHGSILGPLFFIIYVNDLGDASRLEYILFADDANLFISEKDPVPLNNILNSELNKLLAWFATYKLLDHDKKKDSTMILTFSSMGKKSQRLCSSVLYWTIAFPEGILQKRAIRIVSRSGCDAYTNPIFK